MSQDNSKFLVLPRGRPFGKDRVPLSKVQKRVQNKTLERNRRDQIKDSFIILKQSVPALYNEKLASRAQILEKAAEYILLMTGKTHSTQQDINDLYRQNNLLETQIRILEKAQTTGNYVDPPELHLGIRSGGGSHDTNSSDGEGATRRI